MSNFGSVRDHRTSKRTRPARPLVAAISQLRLIPSISMLGLITIGIGLGADFIAHADPALDHGHGTTGAQLSAHFVAFVGMVVVLVGVVVDGLRSSHRR